MRWIDYIVEVLSLVCLSMVLAAQHKGVKTANAPPPFIYAFASHFQNDPRDDPKTRGNYIIQSELRPFTPAKLTGTSFTWHDSAQYDGGSFDVDGSVKNDIVKIHFAGNITTGESRGKFVNRCVFYTHTLEVFTHKTVHTARAEATVTGMIGAQYEGDGSALATVGAGLPHFGTVKTSENGSAMFDGKGQVMRQSGSQTVSIRGTSLGRRDSPDDSTAGFLGSFGISRYEPPGLPGYELALPDKYRTSGYTLQPLRFGIPELELSAQSAEGVGTAQLDLTLTVRLSANSRPLPLDDSSLKLTKATTKDARSVTVDCKVPAGLAPNSLNLKVYRSSKPTVDPASDTGLLGQANVDRDDKGLSLTPGTHQITLLKGTDLPPDPAKPYVVVVAIGNGKTTQTFFRKWRLATVAHGYAGRFKRDRIKTWAWVKKMEGDLLSINRFDKAMAFNWVEDSWKAKPNMTVVAGQRLAQQITDYRTERSKQHPGDVVDVHLIGHSRGTIVTSEALKALSGEPQTGSYVQVTLLDIHPASPTSKALCDRWPGSGEIIEWRFIDDFQRKPLIPRSRSQPALASDLSKSFGRIPSAQLSTRC